MHAHDHFFKAVFSDPARAAEHLGAVLPPALVASLDLTRAELVPASFVDAQLSERHADLLFRVPRLSAPQAEPLLLYLLFEHQSTVDILMPLRLLRYQLRIWDEYLTRNPEATCLPPIVPIVLYHGERPWTAPRDVFDLLDLDPREARLLRPLGPHLGYVLEDLGRQDDRALPGSGLGRLALHLLKHIWRAGLPDRVLQLELQARSILSGDWREFSFVVEYLLHAGDPRDRAALERLIVRLGPRAQEVYMTIAEQIRQEAALKAHQEGLDEGKREGKWEVARNLLARGMSPDQVSEFTDLPLEEITALAEKLPARADRVH